LILSLTYSHFPTDVSFPLNQNHKSDAAILNADLQIVDLNHLHPAGVYMHLFTINCCLVFVLVSTSWLKLY